MKKLVSVLSLVLALTSVALIAPAQAAEPVALHVAAASSLTNAMTKIGADFHALYPNVTVNFTFGSSGTLATQINNGADFDVFASAAPDKMKIVKQAGKASNSYLFATNAIVLAFPKSNPHHITKISNLNNVNIHWARCVSTAPCGAISNSALYLSGVDADPTTTGADATATLALLTSHSVDAALIYESDALMNKATMKYVSFKPAIRSAATTAYPIAKLTASTQSSIADKFIALVRSKSTKVTVGAKTVSGGQVTLKKFGFKSPY